MFFKKIGVDVWHIVRFPFRVLTWFWTRPTRYSTRCIIARPDGKILTVRLAYFPARWTFPGGGLEKDEMAEQAVIREVYEETGIHIMNPCHMGTYEWEKHFRKHFFDCFYVVLSETPVVIPDPYEIADIQWIDVNGPFPEPHAGFFKTVIGFYMAATNINS